MTTYYAIFMLWGESVNLDDRVFYLIGDEIAERSEFKDKKEPFFPVEDRGPVDWAVDRSCTKHAQEVVVDCSVDRIEEDSCRRRHRLIGRSTDLDCQELLKISIDQQVNCRRTRSIGRHG